MKPSLLSRPARRLTLCALFSLICAAWPTYSQEAEGEDAGGTEEAETAKHEVQFVVPKNGLSRLAPLTVRFPNPMVEADAVGKQVDGATILKSTPEVKGKFTWTSRYGGSFQPDVAPGLNSAFDFSLAAGLKDATGTPVTPPKVVKVLGPKFVVNLIDLQMPKGRRFAEVRVFGNDTLDPKSGSTAFFVDKAGRKVPAISRPLTRKELGKSPPAYGTYAQQAARQYPNLADNMAVSSTLVFTPKEPLPVGENWKFSAPDGVANAGGAKSVAFAKEVGTIVPFLFTSLEPESPLNDSRVLHVYFNKNFADGFPVETLMQHVQVEPMPEGATWEISGYAASLKGAFDIGEDYKVTIQPGLPDSEGLVLAKGHEQTIQFQPHQAELSLPAFDHIQWLNGRKEFEFIVANCETTKVQIKRVDPQNIVYALRAYQSYAHDPNGSGAFTRIPYPAMIGKTVWEKSYRSQVDLDKTERFKFTWEEALGGAKAGVYFVNVEGTPKAELEGGAMIGSQALVQLTDIGLAWKYNHTHAQIFAFSHTSGQPMKDLQLMTFDDDANPLDAKTTDASGLATLRLDEKCRWMVAVGNQDWHGIEFYPGMSSLDMWAFDISYSDNAEGIKKWRDNLIFTDRPVYQPGETVFFKAITRLHSSQGLEIPAFRKARLTARDLQGRLFLEKDIEFSETGTYADSIVLPANGVGYYSFSIAYEKTPEQLKIEEERRKKEEAELSASEGEASEEGAEEGAGEGEEIAEEESEEEMPEYGEGTKYESSISHYVLVQEYQPNAFKITFDAAAAKQDGEVLSVPARAAYFMGKALSDATLKWTSTLSQERFYADKFFGYEFCHAPNYHVWDGQEWRKLDREDWQTPMVTGQGAEKLGNKGETTIPAKIPATFGVPGPKQIRIDAEVTDMNQQTIADSYSRLMHSSEFYIGVERLQRGLSAGTDVPIELIAVKTDGQRYDQPVPAKILVEHLQWNAVKVETAGGGTETRHDLTYVKEFEQNVTISPEVAKETTVLFKPKAAGTYNVTVTANDAKNQPVRTIVSFEVYGGNAGTWVQEDGPKIELTPDKDSYTAGETANIIVKTPFKGQALVTVEREKVHKSFLVNIDGNASVVQVPIEDAFAPNCFVSVLQIRGGAQDPREFKQPDYKIGFAELTVESKKDHLTVELQPLLPEVLPGSEVTVTATVKDHAGNPVPKAELALWAVDEGILSLVNYETQNAYDTFHYTEPLSVATGISLTSLLPENPEERDYSNKGFVIGGGGEGDQGQGLRKEFKPLAFWNAFLTTGEDGKVTVKFNAPDGLTTYRIIAIANEGVTRFGQAESEFKVNKPLMVEPALPRFANVGDEITLRAVVHNTAPFSGDVDVTLELDEHVENVGDAAKKLTKTVNVPSGQSKAVPFPVKYTALGAAVLKWSAKAKGADLADAVQSTTQVGTVQPLLRDIQFATIDEKTNVGDLLAKINPELLDAKGELQIELSNSRVIDVADAITQVLHYPYGCAEQTSSAIIPWAALRDLKKALPDLQQTDAEIALVVQKGVNRLLSMQQRNGGLGYWPDATKAELWASAHGGLALVMASKMGANVPPSRLDSLLRYLSKSLRDAAKDQDAYTNLQRCLALYTLALAGKAEPAYHEVLAKKADQLPDSARGYLALAIAEAGGDAEQCAALLAPNKNPAANFAWLGERCDPAVQALVYMKLKDDANAEAALNNLINKRAPRGDWLNTYSNSWAILAISEHARSAPRWQAGESATLTFNGNAQDVAFGVDPTAEVLSFMTQPGGKLPTLSVKIPAGRKLYARIEASARASKNLDQERASGFAIARSYQKIDTLGKVIEGGDLRVGDLVLVSLQVDLPGDSEYLVIDDPLPATMEAINPNFSSMTAGNVAAWTCDHREMRRDRVLFFRNFFKGNGRFQSQYLARITAPGTVTTPNAKIEEMYDPAKFGLTPADKLTTLPAEGEDIAGK